MIISRMIKKKKRRRRNKHSSSKCSYNKSNPSHKNYRRGSENSNRRYKCKK